MVNAMENVEVPRMLKYLRAAASPAGLLPPVLDGGKALIDGSTMISVDLVSTVERCREVVDRDEDIVLDIILTHQCKSRPRISS